MSLVLSRIYLRKEGEKMEHKKTTKKRVKLKTIRFYNLEGKTINEIILKLIENEVESRS